MNINDLQQRNYDAQLKRGKITEETTLEDCIDDLAGEVLELYEEKENNRWLLEAADVMLNLLSCCRIAGFDGEELYLACQRKMLYNEKRTD